MHEGRDGIIQVRRRPESIARIAFARAEFMHGKIQLRIELLPVAAGTGREAFQICQTVTAPLKDTEGGSIIANRRKIEAAFLHAVTGKCSGLVRLKTVFVHKVITGSGGRFVRILVADDDPAWCGSGCDRASFRPSGQGIADPGALTFNGRLTICKLSDLPSQANEATGNTALHIAIAPGDSQQALRLA
ncbi:MAG: hypothetical protein AAFX90_19455 [Pseudomonadota bacterium]